MSQIRKKKKQVVSNQIIVFDAHIYPEFLFIAPVCLIWILDSMSVNSANKEMQAPKKVPILFFFKIVVGGVSIMKIIT